jgi:hypothetical protein
MLDPGVLQAIRQSAGQLAELENEFIQQLHYEVTTLIPDLAGGGWGFCERMVQALLWAALTDQPPQVVADTLRRVGAMNQADGFSGAHYVSIAHALVRAVRDLIGDDWSTSMGSAWISYFLWVKSHLVAGAQQGMPPQGGTPQGGPPQGVSQPGVSQPGVSPQGGAPQGMPPQGVSQPAAAPLAAEQRPARARGLSDGAPGGRRHAAAEDVDLEPVPGLLDDEDDEADGASYGQIMVPMTHNPRRRNLRHPG